MWMIILRRGDRGSALLLTAVQRLDFCDGNKHSAPLHEHRRRHFQTMAIGLAVGIARVASLEESLFSFCDRLSSLVLSNVQ
jgi:hypothetical protein